MKIMNTCCGSHIRRKIKKDDPPIPDNPKVRRGVAVIYLGSGYISIKGKATHTIYHASDHRRQFSVFSEDAKSVLRHPDIILMP